MKTLKSAFIITLILALAWCLVLATSCGDDDDDDDEERLIVWADSTSGLRWQVTPLNNYMTWPEAKSYCENLTLAGGGWRLPTISELRSLIRGCDETQTGGSCGVTDSCLNTFCQDSSCDGCSGGGGPADGCYWPSQLNGNCLFYWSTSTNPENTDYLWSVGFDHPGFMHRYMYDDEVMVRCVR